MKRSIRVQGIVLLAAILDTSAAAEIGATPDTLRSALSRCANIGPRDERLSCFDALVVEYAKSAPTVAAAPLPAAQAPAHSAPLSPAPSSAPAAVPLAAASPAPSSAPAPRVEDFGLSTTQKEKAQTAPPHLNSIKAVISAIGQSSSGRMLITLDNGQSWELDNADPLLRVGAAVTIDRGALGSFVLSSPTHRYPHVRRLQ
jgi:hypothetical protein